MITAFPKIFHVGTDYIKDLFKDEVEITEKVDGSQFVFGKVKGELYLRSKGCMQYVEKHDKMFDIAVDYVASIQDRLPDDTMFFCEYLGKPKHNTICYENVPKNNLALFGIMSTSQKLTSSYEELQEWANKLEIDTVPLIYKGKIENVEELFKMLEIEAYLGGKNRKDEPNKVEGVVVKNYNQPFLLGGQPIPVMAGKLVSEEFKEVHRKTWNKENTDKGKFDTFKRQYCTEARWQKAVQHLKEKGELTNEPKDIGKLLKEVNEDIISEEKESIKEQLWKMFSREVLGASTRGLPEWYKNELAKKQFEGDIDEQ